MTFFLGDQNVQPDTEAMERNVPSRGERAAASFRSERISRDQWQQTDQYRRTYLDELIEGIGGVEVDLKTGRGRPYPAPKQYQLRRDAALAKITSARASDPQAFSDMPASLDEFEQSVTDRLRADYEEQQAIMEAAPDGSWGPELAGSFGANMSDEYALLSLPLGAPARASLPLTMAIEGGANAVFEGVQGREKVIPQADRLGIERPNIGQDMAVAGLMGAGLGGAMAGAARYFEYRRAKRFSDTGDAMSGLEVEKSVSAAEEALSQGKPLDTVPPPREAGAPELPAIPADAPPNWQAIRGGIFAGESGGDYEALFAYSNRSGGPFENVKLTEMTVDEAIAFSDPNGQYGQWVKGRIGRVATPMGAYQIVGKTLRSAKRGLKLTGNELMTPELQERLGIWIYKQQGTGAWVGYRGPNAAWQPEAGATSRGYTGAGQVRAGDEITIDVDYEVVDASLLQRAGGDLQPRDRSRGASDAWINDTAARLDPALLMPSPSADRGAPIVGPDNVIESGNGRSAAIDRAYAEHPDRAAAYRRQIELAGFAIPEGVERPVLIARRTSALDDAGRRDFVVAAQDSGVARMTPTEVAQVSARAMTADKLAIFDPSRAFDDVGNGNFVKSVLSSLPRSERNAMFDASGQLNAEGRRRLSGAFFARAWDAPDLIARFAETEQAGELKSFMAALEKSAPDWATMRAEIEAGHVQEAFDISGFVTDAMRMIAQARDAAGQGQGVADILTEMLDDVDLLEGAVPPLTVRLVKQFFPRGRASSADAVADFLTRYAREARAAGKAGDMFSSSPQEVLARLDARFGDLPDDLGRPRGSVMPERIDPIDEEVELPAIADLDTVMLRSNADDEFLDFEITMDDGTRVTPREILDDHDQDRALIEAVNTCYLGGGV